MISKSILKNALNPNQLEEKSRSEPAEDRNRRVALVHAHRLQAQKDVESQVLEATEAFLDFPRGSNSSSSQLDKTDILAFQELIKPFQVSDYDELLEERRIADKCGYIFCPNAPQKQDTNAKFRIFGRKKGQNFKVVETSKLEMWCSSDCARRALYIKAQLLEEPAWLRRGGVVPNIVVLTGDSVDANGDQPLETLDNETLQQAMKTLSFERGEEAADSRAKNLVKETIIENRHAAAPDTPQPTGVNGIEGYEPRATNSQPVPLANTQAKSSAITSADDT